MMSGIEIPKSAHRLLNEDDDEENWDINAERQRCSVCGEYFFPDFGQPATDYCSVFCSYGDT